MNNNCTILINSSDKYCDTWAPFFTLFNKYWENCPFELMLNTESMVYHDNIIKVKCLELYKDGQTSGYGERLLAHLRAINTKYVLMVLDDFFLREPVNITKLLYLIDQMDQNSDIVTFTFEAIEDEHNIDDKMYDEYFLRNQCSEWKFNLQGALWRKDVLVSLIRPHENPWSLERMGTIRSFRDSNKFYVLKKQEYSPINYGKTPGLTWGIVRGKWVKESVVDFFEENGIEIDYQKRGFLEPGDINTKSSGEKINLINTFKSIGIFDALDLYFWRCRRFVQSRIGLKYYSSYTDYRRARLNKK